MIAIDHWRLATDDGGPFWDLPVGASHALDLRRVPDMSQVATPMPSLFWFPGTLPATARRMGRELSDTLTPANRSALAVAAGVTQWSSQPDTVLRAILMIFGDRVSVDEAATPRPLVPTVQRELRLHFGPHVHREPFRWGQHPQTDLLRAIERERIEREWSAAATDAERDHLRKVVDYQRTKFAGSDWREFVREALQADFADVQPHETTLSDAFTDADAVTIYNHNAGFAWNEVRALASDPTIVSNRIAGNTAGTHYPRAQSDLSSDDMLVECIDCTIENSINSAVAAVARWDSDTFTATDCYMFYRSGFGAATFLLKRVNGTQTILATTTLSGAVTGDRIGCEVNGSSLVGYRNLASLLTASDTAVVAFTRSGFGISTNVAGNTSIGSWQAADLVLTNRRRVLLTGAA